MICKCFKNILHSKYYVQFGNFFKLDTLDFSMSKVNMAARENVFLNHQPDHFGKLKFVEFPAYISFSVVCRISKRKCFRSRGAFCFEIQLSSSSSSYFSTTVSDVRMHLHFSSCFLKLCYLSASLYVTVPGIVSATDWLRTGIGICSLVVSVFPGESDRHSVSLLLLRAICFALEIERLLSVFLSSQISVQNWEGIRFVEICSFPMTCLTFVQM